MSGSFRFAQVGRLVFLALLTLYAVPALRAAPPNTLETIQTGAEQLAEGRLEEALRSFQTAAERDPQHGQAHFFIGVTLNRLERADEALHHLSRAAALGTAHPDLPFETGWSLLMLRRWEDAIEQLNRYEAANPGRGQTSEFVGRAYLALGRLDEAEAAFARALKHDPELIETVSLYRALLQQRRGDERKAAQELSILLRDVGDSRAAQVVRAQLDPVPGVPGAEAARRPWRLGVAIGAGYNSNARGTQALDPLADVPEEGSAFLHLGLDASYTLLETAAGNRLTAGYQLLADAYVNQEQDPDLLDQYGYVNYAHALSANTSAVLRLSINHTMVGEDTLRTQLGARGSLFWRALPALLLETSYAFAHDEYARIVLDDPRYVQPPVLDRDADAHTLTIGAHLDVPRTDVRLRGGYFYSWNFAEQNDFTNQAEGFFAGASLPLGRKMTAEAAYVYTFERYEDVDPSDVNPSVAVPGRRDAIHGLTARLTRQLTPKLSAYVEYSYNRDNSTEPGYDYEQHVTSAGLAWQF